MCRMVDEMIVHCTYTCTVWFVRYQSTRRAMNQAAETGVTSSPSSTAATSTHDSAVAGCFQRISAVSCSNGGYSSIHSTRVTRGLQAVCSFYVVIC